jgi:protoheme IX farnesyltransferase
LLLGGMAITAAANTLNQIFEVRQDTQMLRTQLRPLPTRALHAYEAWVFAGVLALGGLVVLYLLHPICGLLGAVALCSYAFVYTPMKRLGVWAVYMGAIPGALPPMIGVVAATGQVTSTAWLLFLLQFIWQFPHFWAIAWVAHDDYARAGYHLLPSKGRDVQSALQITLYAFLLVPVGMMPWLMDYTSSISASVLSILGLVFFGLGLRLLRTKNNDDAMRIMFASFLYLPLALLTVYLDKITVQ